MKDKQEKEHPSFGVASLSRANGCGALYGSPLHDHFETIRLRISHSTEVIDGFISSYYAKNPNIIEVEFSMAQFSEFITTMNVNDGIPCTIRRLGKESISGPSYDANLLGTAATEFERHAKDATQGLASAQEVVKQLYDDKKINKTTYLTLHNLLRGCIMQMASNMPYIMTQMQEAAESIKSKASAEIAAMAAKFQYKVKVPALSEPTVVDQAIAEIADNDY